MREEYLLTLVKGVSCEGQERPLTVLKEHHMYGKHVCPRWKISNIGRMLSLHSVRTRRWEETHVSLINGTFWSLEAEKVCLLYVFDLKAQENTCSHLKLWFSNVLLSPGRQSHLHSCQSYQEGFSHSDENVYDDSGKLTRGRRGRERCLLNVTVTVYSIVKLITLNYYMKVSCGRLDSANLTAVFWQSCHLDCRHVVA